MCHFEEKWVLNNNARPSIWSTVKTQNSVSTLPFNNCHTTIKFTVEVEDNSTIPFLEILIKRHSHTFSTYIYRKKTFTRLYTKWDSFAPTKYKVNLIRTLNYNFVVSASVPRLLFCTLVWMKWGSCCCKMDTLLVISVTTLKMFWTGRKANRPMTLQYVI